MAIASWIIAADVDASGFTINTVETGARPRITSPYSGFNAVRIEEPTTNFVKNPQFGTGTVADWTNYTFGGGSSALAYTTPGDAPVGSGGAGVLTTGGSGQGTYSQMGDIMTAGSHTGSLYVKGTAGKNVRLSFFDNEGFTSIVGSIVALTGAWQRLSVVGTVSASSVSGYLFVEATDSGNTTLTITGAQFEKKAYATTYCDGSLGTGYAWSGTANASASSRNSGMVAMQEVATTNLCTNPSFETDTTGWTSFRCTMTRTTLAATQGVYALSLESTATFAYAQYSFGVLPAGAYAFSVDEIGVVGATDCRIFVGGVDSGAYSLTIGKWTRKVVTFTLGAPTAVTADVYARYAGGALGDAIYIDAVQLEALSYATTYCDGSLGTGYAWTGTANASTSTRAASSTALSLPSGSSARSFIVWLAPLSLQNDNQPILSYGSSAFKQGFMLSTGSGADKAKFKVGFYGADAAVSNGAMVAGTSYCIGVTIDGSGNIVYYINGSQSGTSSMAGINTVLNGQVYVGGGLQSWSTEFGDISVTGVVTFNTALNDAAHAYFAGLSRPPYLGEYSGQAMTSLFWGQNTYYWLGGTEILTDVWRSSTPLTTTRGLDHVQPSIPAHVGDMSLELDNVAGTYNPATSPITDTTPVQVWAFNSPTLYTIWNGVLDRPRYRPALGVQAVQLNAIGQLGAVTGKIPVGSHRISTALYASIRTDQALGYVLDAAGFSSTARSFDVGLTTLDWWWVEDQDPWTAVQSILAAEGPTAALYEDGAGNLVFKNRTALTTATRSNTSQATLSDTVGASVQIARPFNYSNDRSRIVNTARWQTEVRTAKALSVVWTGPASITLTPGQVLVYNPSNANPFTAAVCTAGTDYTVTAGAVTVVLDRTSGQSLKMTLTAGAAGTTLTGLQLRAQLVSVDSTTDITNTINTPLAAGTIAQPLNVPQIATIPASTAQVLCNEYAGLWAAGRPVVTVTLVAISSAALTQQLTREVYDRITVVENNLGINGDYFILSVDHAVEHGGSVLTTTFNCVDCAAVLGGWDFSLWNSGFWGD